MLHIIHVQIQVKPEVIDAFITATLENGRSSIQEPGIIRFDFLQDAADPTHFTLVEVYRTPEDQQRHRETAHYLKWRDTVADMMAAPRTFIKYVNLLPGDAEWES
ncbi:MAG: antibiotic biosynthesis monooxygenase [Anaerolineae bacterium]